VIGRNYRNCASASVCKGDIYYQKNIGGNKTPIGGLVKAAKTRPLPETTPCTMRENAIDETMPAHGRDCYAAKVRRTKRGVASPLSLGRSILENTEGIGANNNRRVTREGLPPDDAEDVEDMGGG